MAIKDKLIYKELDVSQEKDKKIMDRIISFDKNKTCFGDYDFYEVSDDYVSLAIYIGNKLIGYVGFTHNDSIYYSEKGKYEITICLRKEYQSQGYGDIILKQTISTLFSEYYAKKIVIEVIEENDKCNKLIKKNNFIKSDEDAFLINGNYVKSTHYIYTEEEYKKDKNKLKVYGKII